MTFKLPLNGSESVTRKIYEPPQEVERKKFQVFFIKHDDKVILKNYYYNIMP